MTFTESLSARSRSAETLLCVGLDPDISRFPEHIKNGPDPVGTFCRAVIDATAQYACAFKPQIAYFAALRAESVLEALIDYIHTNHPGIPVILDAKRGDIGSTAKQYAREAFERYKADAVTLSPYMGFDTVEPYMENFPEKGIFLLCRTSNPGGRDIEELKTADGRTVFEIVAEKAQKEWNKNGELGLVAGATQPSELARIRSLAPTLPLLIPGIGAQGGDVNAAVAAGLDAAGFGIAVNSSRAILYAGKDEMFAQASAAAAKATRDAINTAKAKALAARG
ncbi:orotidine-5'-phosphate decarboxylase [Duodenibacillus massiliensis]|uniref:orotidine-5'-phosphate decarboxylase n=1 Tax=Duodenibacillus massiliensis TaxID=1852381 RepID=UPI00258D22BA|nr:orotidine-5'-phosphate decarboxylase [uncultured Duodenibacillus sp.]